MTDLEAAQFSATAPIRQGGASALTSALAEASRALDLNAERAGYRIAYGTAELSTETRTISEQVLVSTIARLTHQRILTITAVGLRADQIATEATA